MTLSRERRRHDAAAEAAEQVSPSPEDPFIADAAFDRAGVPVVAWIGRPGYRGEFPPAERKKVALHPRSVSQATLE